MTRALLAGVGLALLLLAACADPHRGRAPRPDTPPWVRQAHATQAAQRQTPTP